MKKTNKTFKRFAAITSASLLAACAMAPVFTSMTSYAADPDKGSITISNSTAGHTYEAYQIFDGELSDNVKLSNITWGTGVAITNDALDDLAKLDNKFAKSLTYELAESQTEAYETWKTNTSTDNPDADVSEEAYYVTLDEAGKELVKITPVPYVTTDEKVASKIAEALVSYGDAASFAEVIGKYLSDVKTGSSFADGTYTIGANDLLDGYYLVKDADNALTNEYDAKTSYIVKVAGTVTNIAPKIAMPEVDKEVWDNENDGDWDETADWNINDKYLKDGEQQAGFKLEAKIPANDNLEFYETYKIVFNDTMSAGVTFDGIRSVKVGDVDVPLYNETTSPDGYKISDIASGTAGGSFTLEIADLLKYDSDLTDADTIVTVIYNAHLNENAVVSNQGENSIENKNNVYLNYSNNPNWSSSGGNGDEELGKTPDDTVWVATYQILNNKIDGNSNEALKGVGFKLKDSAGNVIKLALDGNNVYYPSSTGEEIITSIGDDARIDIKGLDYGNYTLVEESPLSGYNTCDPILIEIKATHQEDSATAATVTMTDSKNMNNTIENFMGSTLPGTGGIGTTIFYLGGGAMAAIGGIYLISKRRMRKSEE
ncbi:MAG: isopeptide-forming domain-containing fimbrial protein [Lachnospira sp.]|nr:isopeptide-forming domain-containing fimbrial protein [Lachnospira sp.]MBQ6945130.1 isopeptide-forming domain-containing fimbrial protein [Ruminococcus sp.]